VMMRSGMGLAPVPYGSLALRQRARRNTSGLGQVLDDGKTTGHVAIQRAIAGGHFALVARGQHNAAKFVGQRHQQRAADAGLDVFFGGVLGPTRKLAASDALKASNWGTMEISS
jgi:hypothetical protein